MNPKVKKIVLSVIIIVALGFIARNLTKPANKPNSLYKEVLVDVVANKVFLQELDIAKVESFPVASPYSEGKNAYPALQCEKDQSIYAHKVPPPSANSETNVVTDPSQVSGPAKCPLCGSLLFSKPQLPAGVESMDIKGPVKIVPQ